MDYHFTALERAYHLAETGQFATTTEIKFALKQEGYSCEHITGRVLMRQLKKIIAASRAVDRS